VTGTNAVKATANEWAAVHQIQSAVPDATVTLRVHKIQWKRNLQAPPVTAAGILVTQRMGPFTLRREFAVGEAR
jgi:hypothetical protein